MPLNLKSFLLRKPKWPCRSRCGIAAGSLLRRTSCGEPNLAHSTLNKTLQKPHIGYCSATVEAIVALRLLEGGLFDRRFASEGVRRDI